MISSFLRPTWPCRNIGLYKEGVFGSQSGRLMEKGVRGHFTYFLAMFKNDLFWGSHWFPDQSQHCWPDRPPKPSPQLQWLESWSYWSWWQLIGICSLNWSRLGATLLWKPYPPTPQPFSSNSKSDEHSGLVHFWGFFSLTLYFKLLPVYPIS